MLKKSGSQGHLNLVILIAAIGISAVLTQQGCAAPPSRAPITFNIAIDTSDPSQLASYALTAYRAQLSLQPADRLRISAFGHKGRLLYEGSPIFNRRDFARLIVAQLADLDRAVREPATRPAGALSLLTAARNDAHRCFTLLLVDGGVEEPEEWGGFIKAVTKITDARGEIWIAGLRTEWLTRLFADTASQSHRPHLYERRGLDRVVAEIHEAVGSLR